jgi:ribosomal protein L28
MYKCELCGKRRGFGMDHSRCSKKLQETYKDRPRLEYKKPVKPYSPMYGRV